MDKVTLRAYAADQLAEILPAWQRLARSQSSTGLFAAPLWVVNYWRFRRHAGPMPTLLAGYAPDGRLVGLAPLTRMKTQRGLPRLVTVRAPHATGEYPADWCCDGSWAPDFVSAVFEHLRKHERMWLRLSMNTAPDDSPILEALRQYCLARNLAHEEHQGFRVPVIPVDGPESDALALLSGKHRREMVRRTRGLAKLGELEFLEVRTVDQLKAHFEEFVSAEGSGWKGREGGAIARQPDARAFWLNLATEAAEDDKLRLHLLRCGGQTVAGQLGINWGDRYYCLKVGHDERYRQFGPGAMVTRFALQCCMDDPTIRAYDFAGAAQPYMAVWTTQSYGTAELVVGHPNFLLNSAFRTYLLGKGTLRTVRRIRRRVRGERPLADGA
jgi:CelD/BcsL family acetyltransferase involved in cellulose biosynthesis